MKYLINRITYYWDDGGLEDEKASGSYQWIADDENAIYPYPTDNRTYCVLAVHKDGRQGVHFGKASSVRTFSTFTTMS